MSNLELYRQVFLSFKRMCAEGRQPGTFSDYCRSHGVEQKQMRSVLKEEFQPVRTLPGYKWEHHLGFTCLRVYEEFKRLCAEGKQPGNFKDYCESFGITRKRMHGYLNRKGLRIAGSPGYTDPNEARALRSGKYTEIPFENIIFEESGFLPADSSSVISVKVDKHVAVCFPPDTDIDVIAKFIKEMGREDDHVGA